MSRKLSKAQVVRAAITWLQQNVPASQRRSSGGTPLAQLLWWCAYVEGEALADYAPKDRAHALREGVGPFKTERHLADYLDSYMRDMQCGMDELERQWAAFWDATDI